MQVFHYVANALKDVPLFDSDTDDAIPAEDSGAVYNDFDYSPMELLQTNGNDFCFSQTTNLQKEDKEAETSTASMQEAVDHAVMAADESVGVQYEHLSWESEYFDNASDSCDESYCQKVYKLVTNYEGCWDSLGISTAGEMMFQRRLRTKWDMPDTVYDAWLIKSGFKRPWFDTHLFFDVLFPDVSEIILPCEDLESIPCFQPVVNSSRENTDTSDDTNSTTSNEGNSSSGSPSGSSSSFDTTRKRRRILSETAAESPLEEDDFPTPIVSSTPRKDNEE